MENKLPEGWKWKKLSDLAAFFYGGAFESSYFNEDGKGVKIIRIRNLKQGFTETYYDGKYDKSYLVQNGDILIGMDGEFNIVKWTGETALLNQRVCKVIVKSKDLLSDFAYRSLVKILKDIESRTAYVTVKHLSAKELNAIKISLPPLETQQKIVAILEKAEETKKLRAQADELTQKLLQSVFLEMFGDPVENPKIWNMKQLKDCIKIPLNSGWSPKCSDDIGGTPVFSLANLRDQGLSDEITKYYSGDLPKKGLDLEIGDLLISRSNTVELVGRIGRYNGNPEKVIYPDLMIRIRLNENLVNALFFEKYMQLNSTRKLIQKVSHGTSGSMVKISQSSLLKLPVILPPIELQQKFTEICNQIEKTTESQQQSSLEINNLFDALMQKAFTGELASQK